MSNKDLINKSEIGNREAIYEKVKEMVVEYLRVNEEEVQPDTNLVDELCADSIALVELGFRFSETFSIPMVEGEAELFIMNNLVDYIFKQMQKVYINE